jgi:hypothetical protein
MRLKMELRKLYIYEGLLIVRFRHIIPPASEYIVFNVHKKKYAT